MQTGLIHIYCGDGKGKTTTGMGLCTRAAGFGYDVLIYQFMKNNKTSERKVLEPLPNVTFVDGLESEKFSFQMNDQEKADRREYYTRQFQTIVDLVQKQHFQILFLDEVIYTIVAGLFDEALLIDFLKQKPEDLEVILTGQGPSEALIELADYVSEIHKVKHPYGKGMASRMGIEK